MSSLPSTPELSCLTARHELPNGSVELLGAVRTVTGSMTLVDVAGMRLLVDCGAAQGSEAAGFQVPEAITNVDAALLTHGHNDHVGSLPVLLDRGFSKPIYGTRATLDLAELVISDGLRLSGSPGEQVAAFRRRFRELAIAVPYDRALAVHGFRGYVMFREAGHILGSASVEICTRESRVICSGDLGRPNSPILRDYNTRWPRRHPVDLVVLESTYGDSEHHATHDGIEAELARVIRRAIAESGHVLIPAFAIGRTQTLLYHLNALVESGRIPEIPVAVDTPLGLAVTDLYERSRALFDAEALARLACGDDPLEFRSLYAVRRSAHSVLLDEIKEPIIVIAGSGMCTGGRIVGHLKALLPLERTHVLFAGYQARGTPGRAIVEAKLRGGSVELDGELVPVRAHVETLHGLSAHADRRELYAWLRAIPDVRRVALHHGEPQAQRAFVEWMQEQLAHSPRVSSFSTTPQEKTP